MMTTDDIIKQLPDFWHRIEVKPFPKDGQIYWGLFKNPDGHLFACLAHFDGKVQRILGDSAYYRGNCMTDLVVWSEVERPEIYSCFVKQDDN